MSDHDEVMERLDWCVAALKQLLQQLPASWEPVTAVDDYEGDPNEEKEREAELDAVREVQPSKPLCTHSSQQLVGGHLRCALCGFDYGATGIGSTPIRQPE